MGNKSSSPRNTCACLPVCGYKQKPLEDDDKNADWMNHVAQHNPNIRLNDLKMPEAHDAATSYINPKKPFTSISRTQRLTLKQQLELGIRLLDLRFAPLHNNLTSDNNFSVQHGPHRGGEFYHILQEIMSFLSEHPNEFIILNMKYEKKSNITMNLGQFMTWVNSIHTAFNEISITDEDYHGWFKQGCVTLSELITTNKRIFVTIHKNFMHEVPQENKLEFKQFLGKNNIFYKTDVFHDRWHNCDDYSVLFIKSRKFLNEHQKDNKFMINQLILTPQAASTPKYATCMKSLRVDQNVKVLLKNKRLQRHIRDIAPYMNWNFLAMDFVDYEPSRIRFICGLNYNINLEILEAKLKVNEWPIDITEKLTNLVVNNNSLWVISWEYDLGIKAEFGTEAHMDITYRLAFGQPAVTKRFQVSEQYEFLMNGVTLLGSGQGIASPAAVARENFKDEDISENNVQLAMNRPFQINYRD